MAEEIKITEEQKKQAVDLAKEIFSQLMENIGESVYAIDGLTEDNWEPIADGILEEVKNKISGFLKREVDMSGDPIE